MRYKDMKLSDISNRAKSPDLEIIEARKLIKELVGRVMRIKSHSDALENLVQDIAEHDPYAGGNDALEDYSNWIEEARMLIGNDERQVETANEKISFMLTFRCKGCGIDTGGVIEVDDAPVKMDYLNSLAPKRCPDCGHTEYMLRSFLKIK